MTLGRVIGRVWATAKNQGLEGLRFLYVQPLNADLKPTGRRVIVTDSMGAGAGELVYWVRGKEASFPFLPAEAPTDLTIVGIVDEVHVASNPTSPPEAPVGAGHARPIPAQPRSGGARRSSKEPA